MGYSDPSRVAFLCVNLTSGASNFATDTKPTRMAVEFWLDDASGKINAALNSKGFSTPVSQTTAPGVFASLAGVETLYGAAMAEMARANVRLGPGERTRGQVFMEMYDDQLESLLKTDLTLAGVGALSAATPYAGGISDSDKSTIEDNTDRVKPSFRRDLMRFPGTTVAGDINRQERED